MQVQFGVDVGGSGVKGAPVDVVDGQLTAKRVRVATPRPATPDAVYDTIQQVLEAHRWEGDVGVAVPAVVIDGVARTAANIDPSWVDTKVRDELERRIGARVAVLNDADAAGLAEMRYGAGRGVPGVVILLTFGTGVGSAVFVDGTLVPNVELGHMEFDGDIAEATTAARLVEDRGAGDRGVGPAGEPAAPPHPPRVHTEPPHRRGWDLQAVRGFRRLLRRRL